LALPFFAFTLFVSAFLLFLVQPIIGKIILPSLGGAPQVWNTCMVFFQAALLAGYAYTHTTSTRLSLRKQLMLHVALLFLPFIFLLLVPALMVPAGLTFRPFDIRWWQPPSGANPIPSTLFLLTVIIGVPFVVVATSAPLLQKWFAHTGHPAAKDPYFLYAASNIGSMGALLAYPFIIEPLLGLSVQSWFWTAGYICLLALVIVCAGMVWKPAQAEEKLASPPKDQDVPMIAAADVSTAIQKPSKTPQPLGKGGLVSTPVAEELTPMRRLRWIALAAVPTSLMLGITTHFTTDLSPVPLFWLMPLTLYLLTFILVFARWPVVWTGLPHTIMLWIQPFVLVTMIYCSFIADAKEALDWPIFIYSMAFFLTTMVCHGELARDRPSTAHLTEFYLLMSLGGVIGGIFNGLIAPIFFKFGAWEFPIAIVLAGLLRPNMRPAGIIEELIAGASGSRPAHVPAKKPKGKAQKAAEPTHDVNNSLTPGIPALALDIGLPLVLGLITLILASAVSANDDTQMALIYFLPLIVSCLFLTRGLRFGLAIALIMAVHAFRTESGAVAYRDRSYFGIISVRKIDPARQNPPQSLPSKYQPQVYTNLLHGSTDHGMNFAKPTDKKLWGNPEEDFSRLPTTYYHRLGPVGLAMEKFNWFHEPLNHFESDVRMPASLVGLQANAFGPMGALVGVWSEPPFAVIGLGTGTMAAYARPFQHCHYYEIDNLILKLSSPGTRQYFGYVQDAKDRGAEVQVLMGDARLRLGKKYAPYDEQKELEGTATYGGPDHFYHLMVVDAFSSDAIPMHLLTREAFQTYFKKLTRDGVLCVHTSNRHVDLVKVVADVTASLEIEDPTEKDENGNPVKHKLIARRGHDSAPGGLQNDIPWQPAGSGGKNRGGVGHYTSEWVMVFRDDSGWENKLDEITQKQVPDYETQMAESSGGRSEQYWEMPRTNGGRFVWTDDYSNIIAVLRDSTTINMLLRLFIAIIVGVGIVVLITKTSKYGDTA